MSDLQDFMAARAAEAEAGDTATATPAPEADSAAAVTETPESQPAADTGSEPAPTGTSEWKFDSAEFDQQHPELAPYRKQLQGSYTKAQQELATQRQLLEGLDEGSVAWVKQVNTLAQTHPAIAAQMLKAEAERLGGQTQAPAPAADPFDGVEPLSEVERLLLEDRRQSRAERQQMQQEMQQLRAARAYAEVEQQFANLEQEAGRKIPREERERIAAWCGRENSANIRAAYRDLNWETAIQRGRDEASASMQQKSAMGAAPNGVAGREAPAGSREPTTRREAIQMMVEAEQAA